MKKTGKIKLQDVVKLENRKMKMIFGGSGSNECLPGQVPCTVMVYTTAVYHQLVNVGTSAN